MQPLVATSSGTLRGRRDGDALAFLGVPYAAPPLGALRFLEPQSAEPWDGVRDALDYGPTAPQPDRQMTLVPEPVVPGDDYLNLNVFTPDLGAVGLPVLVWIHGGGFTAGCNRSPWYHGGRFARDGVVVVPINYRLGAEGFLPIEGAPLNRAVRDWVAALEWVRDNIAGFGGDPAKVTIAGQSAGGVACAALLTCPPARGLFRAAVCMSGLQSAWQHPVDLGPLAQRVGAELDGPVTREHLATVTPQRLVAAQEAALQGRPGMPYAPLVDDGWVADRSYAAIRAGASRGIPLMVGSTDEEFTAVAAAEGTVDEDRLQRRLGRMGMTQADIASYRAAGDEPGRVFGQALTDSIFKAPATWLADAWTTGGGDAYLYAFDWRSTAELNLGAVHCLDIPFAFDNMDAEGVERVTGPSPPQSLADDVHRAWVRFVHDGAPGWDAHDARRWPTMVFDETSKVVDDHWQAIRRIWPQPPV